MVSAQSVRHLAFTTVLLCLCALTTILGAETRFDAGAPSIRFSPEKAGCITWKRMRPYAEICPPYGNHPAPSWRQTMRRAGSWMTS